MAIIVPPSRTMRALARRPGTVITVIRANARGITTRTRNWSCGSSRQWRQRLRNYLKTLTMELTTIARACGKQDVHHLEKEDLVALTVEAAAMAGVPLAGTSWIPDA